MKCRWCEKNEAIMERVPQGYQLCGECLLREIAMVVDTLDEVSWRQIAFSQASGPELWRRIAGK